MKRAFDWPKERACMPAPFTCLDKYQRKKRIKIIGKMIGAKAENQ